MILLSLSTTSVVSSTTLEGDLIIALSIVRLLNLGHKRLVANTSGHDVLEITACTKLLKTVEGREGQVIELGEDVVAVRTPMQLCVGGQVIDVSKIEVRLH